MLSWRHSHRLVENVRGWDWQHLTQGQVVQQLQTVQDASLNTIIQQTVRHSSVCIADHGDAKIRTTESRDHQPQEKEEGDSFCYYCNETHPYVSHTKSRAESRKRDIGAATGQKSHMQSASQCRRCKMEVRDSPQTCGACGQTGKPGDRLH